MPRQIEIFFYGLFMDRDALRENVSSDRGATGPNR